MRDLMARKPFTLTIVTKGGTRTYRTHPDKPGWVTLNIDDKGALKSV